MLVLTRKLKEEILIGDDIKVTLIKVSGRTVRIGIEAPREMRIRRAELEPFAEVGVAELDTDDDVLSEREMAFAHPQPMAGKSQNSAAEKTSPRNRIANASNQATPQLYVGTVKPSGQDAKLARAPLAEFITAT